MQVLNLLTLQSRVDKSIPWVYLRGNFVLFNAKAVELLGLKPGDRVEFHEDGIMFFYVKKTDDNMGFSIIKTSNSVGISNKALCTYLRDRWKKKASEPVYFMLKESLAPADPYVKWEMIIKQVKNG